MEIKLSCFRCGSTEFKREPVICFEIEGKLYEDEDSEVTCAKCGLKDYTKNLVGVFC